MIREMTVGLNKEMSQEKKLKLVYLDSIIDTTLLQESVILPLAENLNIDKSQSKELISYVSNTILTTPGVKVTDSYQELLRLLIG